MIDRKIVAIETEPDGAVVATLDCGHRRHVVHRPPLASNPWILDAAEREARLGQRIECGRCDALERPVDMTCYRQTAVFEAATIPAGLLHSHTLKPGVWAEIVVLAGRLRYRIAPLARELILEPGVPGVVPPEVPHEIAALGDVRVRIDFYRRP